MKRFQSIVFLSVCISLLVALGIISATTNALADTVCTNGRKDEGCNPSSPCGGAGSPMTVYSFSEYLPGVLLQDTPLTYRPAYGPTIDFTVQYRQVDFQREFTTANVDETTNLGPYWHHPFLSYIRAEDTQMPITAGVALRWVRAEGTYFQYSYNGTSYDAPYSDRPRLSAIAGGYRLDFTDGASMEFKKPNSGTTRYNVTKITDAQGLSLTMNYGAGTLRLASITDATGRVTQFGYLNAIDRKIQTISDPFGRTASFTYDASGRLQSITDPQGIVSSFTYDALDVDGVAQPGWIATLTTPYGTHRFDYDGYNPYFNDVWWLENIYFLSWGITVTDPQGDKERIETFYSSHEVPSWQNEPRPPEVASTATFVGFHTVDHNPTDYPEDHFHATFRWSKKQWHDYEAAHDANADADPAIDAHDFASSTLWLMDADGRSLPIPVAKKEPNPTGAQSPGKGAVWYNYPGQTEGFGWRAGTQNSVLCTARQVDAQIPAAGHPEGEPTWVYTQTPRNAVGSPTLGSTLKCNIG